MNKKGSEKTRHVVAWLNKAEWDQVRDYLYSMDSSLQRFALERISAWRARCADSFPVAVDCTADLVRCQVRDRSGQLTGDDLTLMYGTALVRFVNLITDQSPVSQTGHIWITRCGQGDPGGKGGVAEGAQTQVEGATLDWSIRGRCQDNYSSPTEREGRHLVSLVAVCTST
uniref:Uncharacterized protein n=1 Tax=Maylandia zebra TaxID=106582 RepID=A0A3P9DKM9_9CICH